MTGGAVRVVFVRHGESTANAERWLAGHRDVPLTDAGRVQALAVRDTLGTVHPDRVVASDLQRARITAEIAWEGRSPAVELDPAVRERHLGAWEGRAIRELRQMGAMDVLLSWDGAPPGGESHAMLAARALRFLAAQTAEALLVFGHGGWTRTVLGLLDGIPRDVIGRTEIANATPIARTVAPGAWTRLLAGL